MSADPLDTALNLDATGERGVRWLLRAMERSTDTLNDDLTEPAEAALYFGMRGYESGRDVPKNPTPQQMFKEGFYEGVDYVLRHHLRPHRNTLNAIITRGRQT